MGWAVVVSFVGEEERRGWVGHVETGDHRLCVACSLRIYLEGNGYSRWIAG